MRWPAPRGQRASSSFGLLGELKGGTSHYAILPFLSKQGNLGIRAETRAMRPLEAVPLDHHGRRGRGRGPRGRAQVRGLWPSPRAGAPRGLAAAARADGCAGRRATAAVDRRVAGYRRCLGSDIEHGPGRSRFFARAGRASRAWWPGPARRPPVPRRLGVRSGGSEMSTSSLLTPGCPSRGSTGRSRRHRRPRGSHFARAQGGPRVAPEPSSSASVLHHPPQQHRRTLRRPRKMSHPYVARWMAPRRA